jgi:hypothetical protein
MDTTTNPWHIRTTGLEHRIFNDVGVDPAPCMFRANINVTKANNGFIVRVDGYVQGVHIAADWAAVQDYVAAIMLASMLDRTK